METKERRAPQRRRRPARTRQPAPKKGTHADRRRRRTAPAATKRPRTQKRVIRAPREDIPAAVYTMPKLMQKGKLLLRLATVAAVVVALMMAVSIFFRVETVTVLGAQKYTAWAVSEASGIEAGDGLLTLSRARAAGKIQSALPYVDEVKIDIELPGTVRIEITELRVTYAVAAKDGSWWLISADGEAIEQIEGTSATGYTRLLGVTIEPPTVGAAVTAAETAPITQPTQDETQTSESEATVPTQPPATDAQRLTALLTILRSLESNGVIGEVVSVNVKELSDISLQYGERFDVRLGDSQRLDYKIAYMAQAIRQMEDYQVGVLDVSFAFSEEGIFTPQV